MNPDFEIKTNFLHRQLIHFLPKAENFYNAEEKLYYSFLLSLAKTNSTIMIYFDANKLVANLTNRRKILIKVRNSFTLEKSLQDIGANCQFESKVIC